MIKKIMVVAALMLTAQMSFAHGKHGAHDTDYSGFLKSGDGSYVADGFKNCVAYSKMPKAGEKGCKGGAVKAAPKAPIADADKDGVADSADKCPTTVAGAYVDVNGCEFDKDGDGVVDSKDECNYTDAGVKVAANGCAVAAAAPAAPVAPAAPAVAKTIQLNVNFASGSAVVPASYYGEVANVASFMNQYPASSVVIEGHTDSQGSAAFNKSLSQKRADAIAALLSSKYGIPSSRVSAFGYGEEQPVADNATRSGRAANRRVIATVK